jgi:hypothetical protein
MEATMTLLERFDEVPVHKWPTTVSIDRLRRAIAIAQAVAAVTIYMVGRIENE